ncbi:MAG: alpha/beta fold hydrolase [Clostridia bacterium]|nr:alpha/beta fold hydrolase [Clostridia bacterium]
MKRLLAFLMAIFLMPATVLAEIPAEPVEAVVALMQTDVGADTLYQHMHPDVQAALGTESIKAIWPQLTAIGGKYLGLADNAETALQGEYTVYSRALQFENCFFLCQLSVTQDNRIYGLWFNPVHITLNFGARNDAFSEEEVLIGEEPWTLPGTLTLPAEGEGPFPAVVLVHGSGPADRNESIGVVKPFRDLAEGLAQQGIAVLRYDKRTYVYGQQIAASEDYVRFTVEEETIQDALYAGRLLAADSRIDSTRIFVLGHSLGGMLAPRLVSESDGLYCGMILACASNRSLLDIILRQNEDALSDGHYSETYAEAVRAQLDQARKAAEALRDMPAETALQSTMLGQSAYYYWDMAQHPAPAEYLHKLQLPVLIINGSRDFQVNEEEGRLSWEKALDLDQPWITTLFTDVNHMLMKPEVDDAIAGTSMEYNIECTVDGTVTEAIADFILTNGGN